MKGISKDVKQLTCFLASLKFVKYEFIIKVINISEIDFFGGGRIFLFFQLRITALGLTFTFLLMLTRLCKVKSNVHVSKVIQWRETGDSRRV